MAEQDLDRNEAATPFKLEKARQRGSIAKSVDANAVAILAVATVAAFAWVQRATRQFAHLSVEIWHRAGSDLSDPAVATALLGHVFMAGLEVIAPLIFAIACAAVLVNVVQARPVFTFEPLSPDFTRLNPAQGFRKLFALRSVYEALKSAAKLLILGGVLAGALVALAPAVSALVNVHAQAHLLLFYDMVGQVLVKLLLVLFLFALVDYVYTQRHYARQMRMSRREIKDEFKQREGDPRIRSRIRELRAKLLKRTQALRELPKADVLITNPTRVAVAIRYEHGIWPAPKIVAKGAGGLARKMRDVAFRHQVPIVQSVALARALYLRTDDNDYVPEQWYPQVARILIWVQAAKRARASRPAGEAA